MRLVMLQLIVIGSEKIVVLQLLIPLRKDRTIVKAGIAGVIVWGILTVLLVPRLQSVGTCLVWLAAETIVLVIAAIEIRRSLDIRFPMGQLCLSALYSLPYLMMGYLVLTMTDQAILRLAVCGVLFAIYALFLKTKVYRI
jgi:O-antigen/teichoic acid export membrane protein